MKGIKDVANEAGVSVATVSYVINKNKYVSPELTSRVLNAIEKLNYKVNSVASSLRNGKTKTIGVVLQNIRNIFFAQLLYGLEEYIKEQDYSLIFFNTDYDIKKEMNIITTLVNMWVDGIVLYSCVEADKKNEYSSFLRNCKSGKKIPIILLDKKFEDETFSTVMIDNVKGGYDAAKHLIKIGKDRVVHITGIKKWDISIDRMNGYINAMEEEGLSANILVKHGNFRPKDGYEIMKELLQKNPMTNGVFAANDQMAVGAIKAIKEFGLIIPDDIAIVGYDNIFVSTLIEPALTTINVPTYMMGITAAKMIMQMISAPDKKLENVILPANIIIRQSTDIRAERNWELYGW